MIEMVKWADYMIVGVKYNKEPKHINEVKVREDINDKITNEQIKKRTDIIGFLTAGKKIITAYLKEGSWRKGDAVQIFKVNGKSYIKTEGNTKEEDNLGELPEF